MKPSRWSASLEYILHYFSLLYKIQGPSSLEPSSPPPILCCSSSSLVLLCFGSLRVVLEATQHHSLQACTLVSPAEWMAQQSVQVPAASWLAPRLGSSWSAFLSLLCFFLSCHSLVSMPSIPYASLDRRLELQRRLSTSRRSCIAPFLASELGSHLLTRFRRSLRLGSALQAFLSSSALLQTCLSHLLAARRRV